MIKSSYSTLLAAGFLALSGCSAARVVTVGEPGASVELSPYAGQDIRLRAFAVKGTESKQDKNKVIELRRQFASYLKAHGGFREVLDLDLGKEGVPGALIMDVDLQVQIEDDNVSYNKVAFGLYTLYAVAPRKGNLRVIGNATVYRDRRAVSVKSWTSSESYSYTAFGMFRTAPIEKAFAKAYEEVFAKIAVPLSFEGGPAVSKAELQTMVQETMAAVKNAGKVFNSDVDVAAYRREPDARNFALVIGIEMYSSVPPADFGERDAQAVKDHLLALGYPQRNIVHLSGSLASRANIEKYLESWLPEKLAEDSRLLVYFSGHGSPDPKNGDAYLVPWDGDVKFLKNTGYPLKRLYEKLNALKAKTVLVALDSCFSGSGGRSILPQGTRPLVARLDEGPGALGKVVVLSAAHGDEIAGSDNSQGHGAFTYHLLKGLNERKGQATLKDLFDYLTPRVQDAARQENRDQTPELRAMDPASAARFSF